ncbi:unnamed protein product [Linum trigynum]|uniref:Uncharacterized protein n=1 Tax=Linum trigynum TaxID=586398 RepID=A0AAV2FZU6_9ROSI
MSQRSSSSGFPSLSSPLLLRLAVFSLSLLHLSLAAAADARSTPTARGFVSLSPDQGDELKLPWRIGGEIQLSTVGRKGGGGRGGVGVGGGGGGKGSGQRDEGGGGAGARVRRNGAVVNCDRPSGQLVGLVVLVTVFTLLF